MNFMNQLVTRKIVCAKISKVKAFEREKSQNEETDENKIKSRSKFMKIEVGKRQTEIKINGNKNESLCSTSTEYYADCIFETAWHTQSQKRTLKKRNCYNNNNNTKYMRSTTI